MVPTALFPYIGSSGRACTAYQLVQSSTDDEALPRSSLSSQDCLCQRPSLPRISLREPPKSVSVVQLRCLLSSAIVMTHGLMTLWRQVLRNRLLVTLASCIDGCRANDGDRYRLSARPEEIGSDTTGTTSLSMPLYASSGALGVQVHPTQRYETFGHLAQVCCALQANGATHDLFFLARTAVRTPCVRISATDPSCHVPRSRGKGVRA